MFAIDHRAHAAGKDPGNLVQGRGVAADEPFESARADPDQPAVANRADVAHARAVVNQTSFADRFAAAQLAEIPLSALVGGGGQLETPADNGVHAVRGIALTYEQLAALESDDLEV